MFSIFTSLWITPTLWIWSRAEPIWYTATKIAIDEKPTSWCSLESKYHRIYVQLRRIKLQFWDIRLYLKLNQAYRENCSHKLYSVPLSHNGKAMYKCRSSCHARRRGKIPSGLLCLVISFVPLQKGLEHTSWILRSWQSCWISSVSDRIDDLLII